MCVFFKQDVVLARLLDDGTFSTLNSLVFYNHFEICSWFMDCDTLKECTRILQTGSLLERHTVLDFMLELFSLVKTLQVLFCIVFLMFIFYFVFCTTTVDANKECLLCSRGREWGDG